jgi:copper chaperone CopZ
MIKNILLKISGMECPNCAMTLERIEDTLAGVSFAETSYKRSELKLEYDDNLLTEENIRAAIVLLGYQATEVLNRG